MSDFDPDAYLAQKQAKPAAAFDPDKYLAEKSDGQQYIKRDGVQIPLPMKAETPAFNKWMQDNKVRDPYHPDQHYDYVGAFRDGLARAPGEEGHFKDDFKLPGHETFSNESKYAVGENAAKAGSWDGDTYHKPIAQDDNIGPQISAPEMERAKFSVGTRAKSALYKLKAKQPLEPDERDALKQAMGERQIGTLDAMNTLGANSMAGEMGDEALGAIRGGLRALKGDNFGQARAEETAALRDYLKRAKEQHPVAGGAAQLMGGAATGIMLPASRLSAIAQGAVTGLGGSDGADAATTAGNTIMGGAAGGAIHAAVPHAMRVAGELAGDTLRAGARGIGKTMQAPGEVASHLNEWLGGTKLAQRIEQPEITTKPQWGDTASELELKADASRGEALPKNSDTAEPAAKVVADVEAKAPKMQTKEGIPLADAQAQAKASKPGPGASEGEVSEWYERQVPSLNRHLREANPDAAAVQMSRAPGAKESRQMGDVVRAWDALRARGEAKSLPRDYGMREPNMPGHVMTDPAVRAQRMPRDLGGAVPENGPLIDNPGRPSGGDADKPFWWDQHYGKGNVESGADNAMGMGRAQMRQDWQGDSRVAQPQQSMDPNATKRLRGIGTSQDIPVAAQQIEGGPMPQQRKATAWNSDGVTQTQVKAPAPEAQQQAQQNTAPWKQNADDARQGLQKIARGKALAGKFADVVPYARQVGGGGMDLATMLGQHLEALGSGAAKPGQFAHELSANPGLAGAMSQMPGKLGHAGRTIAEAHQSGGPSMAKSRAYVIAQQPWFRELLQQDKGEPAPGSQGASAQ